MFIVSKASQDIEYVGWSKGKNGLNKKEKSVVIKGGANVLNKKTMETVNGVITEVSADDVKFLESLSTFRRQVEAGWMKVGKSRVEAEKKAEAKDVDEDGKVIKDGSAQLTPQDFEDIGQTPPIIDPEQMGVK